MISAGVLFARMVARRLQADPRLTPEEAARQVEKQPGFLPPFATAEYAQLQRDRPIFRRLGLLNPQYLAERLNKRTFLYLIDGRDGRYQALRDSMRNLPQEHSRFTLFGPQDVLLILHGTNEDAEAFRKWLTEHRWPVDIIPVERISRWRNYTVESWENIALNPAWIEAAGRLVREGYDLPDPDLAPIRQRLEEAKILLGPTVIEDMSRTGRVRAFVGIRLGGGHFPMNVEQFERALLESPYAETAFSIYYCGGPYHLLVELICDDLQELDQITEWMQRPPGPAFTVIAVETTTFIVASTEMEMLPTLSLRAPGKLDPLEEELLSLGSDMVRRFRLLPHWWQLFLSSAREEYQRAMPSSIPAPHRRALNHAWQEFIRGILEQSDQSALILRGAFLEAAAVLEETCREALSRLAEWLYKGDLGQAQKDLRLSHVRFSQLALGPTLEAIERAGQLEAYKAIGLEIPRTIMQRLRHVQELRNELTHHVSRLEGRDLWNVAREIRDGLLCILDGINWCRERIIDRQFILIERLPALIRAVRAEKPPEWPVANPEELEELAARIRELGEQDPSLREPLEELIRLATTATMSPRERFWRDQMTQITQRLDEIIQAIRPERRAQARSLLMALSQAGANVTLNLIANAIWSFLAWAQPDQLPHLLMRLLGR